MGSQSELINQIKSLNDVKLINIYSDNIFLHGPSVMMAQCYDRIYVKDTYVLNKLYSIGISPDYYGSLLSKNMKAFK